MLPVGIGRVLVHAAPRRIDDLQRRRERATGHLVGLLIALSGAQQAVLDSVVIDELLELLQTAKLRVVRLVERSLQRLAQLRRQQRVVGELRDRLIVAVIDRARIDDDFLEHRDHHGRCEIAAALDDLAALGVEHDRGRPAIVLVAARDVGACVLIDAHRDVPRLDELDHLGIAVGHLVHDVAPVAPDGFQIQQHKAMFACSALEHCVGPGLPVDLGGRRAGGVARNGPQQEKGGE